MQINKSLTFINLDTNSETTKERTVENTEKFEISIESKQKGAFIIKSVKIDPIPIVPKLYTKLAKTISNSTNVCLLCELGCSEVSSFKSGSLSLLSSYRLVWLGFRLEK